MQCGQHLGVILGFLPGFTFLPDVRPSAAMGFTDTLDAFRGSGTRAFPAVKLAAVHLALFGHAEVEVPAQGVSASCGSGHAQIGDARRASLNWSRLEVILDGRVQSRGKPIARLLHKVATRSKATGSPKTRPTLRA